MDDNRTTEVISQGINPHTDAGSIGGVNAYLDDDGRPTTLLSIATKDGPSERLELHEGDTFELGPERWQVTEIDSPGTSFWTAVLTQLR